MRPTLGVYSGTLNVTDIPGTFSQTPVALVSRVGVKKCCLLVAVSMNSSPERYPSGYLMCTRLEGL